MKDEKKLIKFECKEREKVYCCNIDRAEFYAHMSYLKKAFSPDMTLISEKLLQYIPRMTKLRINEDFNATQDVPFILIEQDNSGEFDILKIPRCNSIIWGFLIRYCYEAKKE